MTILACSIETGEHKLKLAQIGKTKKHEHSKIQNDEEDSFNLPVWYINQSTNSLFLKFKIKKSCMESSFDLR